MAVCSPIIPRCLFSAQPLGSFNVFRFLHSAGKFLRHAAGRAAHLVHVLGAAGAAGARAMAPSHGPGREVEAGEGRGVLQRDTLHSVSDEALVCLISQKNGDAPNPR